MLYEQNVYNEAKSVWNSSMVSNDKYYEVESIKADTRQKIWGRLKYNWWLITK